jgi:hypothetical protein
MVTVLYIRGRGAPIHLPEVLTHEHCNTDLRDDDHTIDGNLCVKGRIKEQINRAGEKK